MADPFGASRLTVSPPERGVFVLDHEGECKDFMKTYLQCLKENKKDYYPCREKSRNYLQCRMDKGLMAKENMDNLGLGEENSVYIRNNDPVESKPGNLFYR